MITKHQRKTKKLCSSVLPNHKYNRTEQLLSSCNAKFVSNHCAFQNKNAILFDVSDQEAYIFTPFSFFCRMIHPHILPFMGYFEDSTNISLVLEYAPNGDLHGYMDTISSKHRLSEARKVLWQVCQALEYLEQAQVAHRDIKPENILCFDDGQVKLGDFGWACWWANGQRRTTLCGTAEYCPPEMLHEKISYNAELIDRWMLGVLAIELVHTTTPFVCLPEDLGLQNLTLDNSKIHNVIFEKIRSFKEISVDRKYSDPAYCDFVGRLMQVEPADRLSATKAMEHEFFVQLGKKKTTLSTFFPSVAQRRQLFENSRGNVKCEINHLSS